MSCCDTIHGGHPLLFLFRRPDIVAMDTAVAMNRRGYRAHHLAKPLRYPDFLPGARRERRQNRASFVLVLSGQIQIQATMNATKQNFCLQRRSLCIVGRTRSVLRSGRTAPPYLITVAIRPCRTLSQRSGQAMITYELAIYRQ